MRRAYLCLGPTIVALASLAATAAGAADLPYRSPPPPVFTPPPVYDWSGFYLGVNAGVGWANGGNATVSDPNRVLPTYNTSMSGVSGFVGGGQIGYNFQAGAFVYGLEADIQYANLGGGSVTWGANYNFIGVNSGGSGEYFGTVRARAGYAIDRTLLYLTGGFAYGGLNTSPVSGNATSNTGYALGGGVEYAMTRNWTIRAEGLYVNLSNGNNRTVYVTHGGVNYPINVNSGNGGGLVRVGVNYKF